MLCYVINIPPCLCGEAYVNVMTWNTHDVASSYWKDQISKVLLLASRPTDIDDDVDDSLGSLKKNDSSVNQPLSFLRSDNNNNACSSRKDDDTVCVIGEGRMCVNVCMCVCPNHHRWSIIVVCWFWWWYDISFLSKYCTDTIPRGLQDWKLSDHDRKDSYHHLKVSYRHLKVSSPVGHVKNHTRGSVDGGSEKILFARLNAVESGWRDSISNPPPITEDRWSSFVCRPAIVSSYVKVWHFFRASFCEFVFVLSIYCTALIAELEEEDEEQRYIFQLMTVATNQNQHDGTCHAKSPVAST